MRNLAKLVFRLCGFEVKRSLPFGPYEWLQQCDIRTVLDIGANAGQFAGMIHDILPAASIISFEPIEECYDNLLKKMGDVPNFRAFNFGLGDDDATVEMNVNDFSPSSSLLPMADMHIKAFPFTAKKHNKFVKIKRLDTVAKGFDLDDNLLVKIDVQGYEDRVIRGGQDTISRAKIVIVETSFQCLYIGQPMFEDIYEVLMKMGFSYRGSLEQASNPLDGRILQADSLFVKDKEKNMLNHDNEQKRCVGVSV